MPTYDSNITIDPKDTRPSTTIVAKATRPTTTIDPKDSRPTTTKVPKPYTEPLAILTQEGVEILMENEIVMTVQGAF